MTWAERRVPIHGSGALSRCHVTRPGHADASGSGNLQVCNAGTCQRIPVRAEQRCRGPFTGEIVGDAGWWTQPSGSVARQPGASRVAAPGRRSGERFARGLSIGHGRSERRAQRSRVLCGETRFGGVEGRGWYRDRR